MQTLLLLTDTPARGGRLARSLNLLGSTVLVDVLDPEQASLRLAPGSVRAIISDVSFATSSTIAALRRHLDRLPVRRIPYLCLLHEDTPRGNAQALALGAGCVLRADQAPHTVMNALSPMLARAPDQPAPIAADLASADAALTRIFEIGRSGGVIEAGLIASGAEFIENALRKTDMRTWLDVVWRFDDATHQHCLLVAGLAAGFAKQLGFRRADCQRVTQAALLHDVGKSRIPIAILNKAGRLDDEERVVMQTHPAQGYDMLVGHGYGAEMLAVVRSHHEYLDGSGYPDGLQSRDIPDLVRLVTICDIYAALIERRPYRAPMKGDLAYAILEDMKGKLDRDLLEAFRPIAVASDSPKHAASA